MGDAQKADLSMALNGLLAGLVGITANADVISVSGALTIGLIAGGIVVVSIIFLDKSKIDDPVGAISVHGVCGIWGTIAVAIFGEGDFYGVPNSRCLIGKCICICLHIVFSILKVMMGVRVSEEEEERGLDISEHGQESHKLNAFLIPQFNQK